MTAPLADHPATYSAEVLPHIEAALAGIHPDVDVFGPRLILDPFAGEGVKFHRLAEAAGLPSLGIELEPEWAACHPRNIVGDATRLPLADGSVDAVITSPCYGNRMADDHEAADACKACAGSGLAAEGSADACRSCKGSGLSRRNTYRHRLGRPLSAGTTANLRFVPGPRGNRYRRLHAAAWDEAHRVLKPYGLMLLNVSNYLETVNGERVEHRVVEWHLEHLIRNGFGLEALVPVSTRRNRHGANGDARVAQEFVARLRRRPL